MPQKWHTRLTANWISNLESNEFFQSNLDGLPLMFAETPKGTVYIFQCWISAFWTSHYYF